MSLAIHCKYKYFDSTVQRAEDRRQKFYFWRLAFAVNVILPIYPGNAMGDSFVLFDVSMEIHHGKFTLGNGGHTRFVSFPR